MALTEGWWAELSRMSLIDMQGALKRFLLERGGEHMAEFADALITTIVSLAPEEVEAPLLRVDRFVEEVGEPPPLVAEGMLEPNTLILLSAKPKTGKSFFALQMAEDIASGGMLFGRWKVCRPGPVVYLAMEGGQYSLRNRIIRRGMHDPAPDVYMRYCQTDLSTEIGVMKMQEIIAPVQPVLVIVDTARQALKIEDWNAAGEVEQKVRPLRTCAERLPNGCSILVLAHNNKNPAAEGGDRISGSNALQAAVQGYWIMDKKKRLPNGDLQAVIEYEGREDVTPKWIWRMDTRTLRSRSLTEEEVEQENAESRKDRQEEVWTQIEDAIDGLGGQCTTSQICDRTGRSDGYIRAIVREMVKSARLVKTSLGPGRGAAPLYALPGLSNGLPGLSDDGGGDLYINSTTTVVGEGGAGPDDDDAEEV